MDNQNIQNLTGSTTVWVGNNPYLVNSGGVIPLTSGFSALSLNQSPPATDSSKQGQFYVVSVQESPTKKSPQGLNNPRTGLGLYDSSALTASSPNLGNFSNNNFQQLQFQPQPINFQHNPGLNQFPPTFTNGQQFPPTFTNGLNQKSTFSNGQQLPKPFPNGPNLQFSPTFTNGQQFPPTFTNGLNQNVSSTFTNGYSTLPNKQKPLTINPTTNNLNGNFQTSAGQHGTRSSLYSANGNSEPVPLASPSLSTSSTSILSESSYGGFSSPDANVSCVYKSDPQSPNRAPSALTGPPTLPKPKRPSMSGKDKNDNEEPRKTYPSVPPRYDKPLNKEYCLRCDKRVYHMEKLGPVKDCLYHKLCFSCVVCNTTLNIKNYHVNPNDMEDLNVYCVTHVPSNTPVKVDAGAMGIKGALGVPKLDMINQQIRGGFGGNGNAKFRGHTFNLQFESLKNQPVKNIPISHLQAANQLTDSSWSRSERQPEVIPPPVSGYDRNTTRLYYSP